MQERGLPHWWGGTWATELAEDRGLGKKADKLPKTEKAPLCLV